MVTAAMLELKGNRFVSKIGMGAKDSGKFVRDMFFKNLKWLTSIKTLPSDKCLIIGKYNVKISLLNLESISVFLKLRYEAITLINTSGMFLR